MSSQTDLIGLGAIAALGYILIKKLEPVGGAVTNTVNTVERYVETTKESVLNTTDSVKTYVLGTSSNSDQEYQNYKNTVNNVSQGVDTVSGQDTSNISRYLYLGGGGYVDQDTGAYIPGAVTNPANNTPIDASKLKNIGFNNTTNGGQGTQKSSSPFTGQTADSGKYAAAFSAMYNPKVSTKSSTSTNAAGPTGSKYSSVVKAKKGGYSVASEM